jgi:hypothetical protein
VDEGQPTPEDRSGLRPSAPHLDGPLGSSGAAPAGEPYVGSHNQPDAAADEATGTDLAAEEATGTDRPVTEAGADKAGAHSAVASDEPGTAPPPTGPPDASAAKSGGREAAATPDEGATTADGAALPGESATSTPEPAESASTPEPVEISATTKPGDEATTAVKPGDEAAGGKAGEGGAAAGKTADASGAEGKTAVITVGSGSGGRVTRVLRRANPVRAARTAGRNTAAWAKRPTGRLVIPGLIALLLVAAAGTAGAYLVPEARPPAPAASATPGFPQQAAVPAPSASGSLPPPGGFGSGPITPTVPGVTGARPADALAGWAQGVGTRVGIPVVAVQAYGYAELVATRTAPNCHLSWTTIAAIAKVESAHGSANGAVLGVDGQVQPTIYGLPLDGRGGRQEIRDTDQGTLDGDTQYDRAIGPLQFIPATWRENAVDADNNGISDPNDIDDASLAAALYLCKGGRDVSRADAWWDAILSYNAVRPYAQKVFEAANDYGVRSRV